MAVREVRRTNLSPPDRGAVPKELRGKVVPLAFRSEKRESPAKESQREKEDSTGLDKRGDYGGNEDERGECAVRPRLRPEESVGCRCNNKSSWVWPPNFQFSVLIPNSSVRSFSPVGWADCWRSEMSEGRMPSCPESSSSRTSM